MARGFIMLDIEGLELTSADRSLLQSPNVGGVILFSRNYESPEQIFHLINEIRLLKSPSLLIAVDHEGGRVQRFRDGFTQIPSMRSIGHLYDQDQAAAFKLSFFIGWIIGAELRAIGVDLCFGPCVDLDWGSSAIIGDRAFHKDKKIVEQLSYKFILGLKKAGMQSVAKHFPGHGFVVNDSHELLPIDRRDFGDLLDDIYPYEGLIRKGAISAVMMSHVVYIQADSMPASISEYWIKDHLRQQLRFDAAVFCDDLSMKALSAYGNLTERAILALKADCDMLIMCNDREGSQELVMSIKDNQSYPSMMRLARLRGKKSITREQLLVSEDWVIATNYLNDYLQQSNFELSG
jgi:beta-N-acetylhexosaminidase